MPRTPVTGRRHFMAASALGVAGLAAMATLPATVAAGGDTAARFVYVGSYTKNPPGGGSNNPIGLNVFRFDPATGALSLIQQVPSANPSFVTLDPTQGHLYVINEIDDYQGQKTGSVESYVINPTTGMITLHNRQSTNGPIPAHLKVDPTGRYLVIANYVGGNFVVLPIRADGGLDPVSGEHMDTGTGPNAQRQEAPHPHAVMFDPSGRYIATADLGIDKVQVFQLSGGGLSLVSDVSVPPGSGPRHVAFNRNGRILYVINELNATVSVLTFDPATGKVGPEIQNISTEPEGYSGDKSTAEIIVHPSNKFVYGSNRGDSSIVGYAIDPASGKLTVLGWANAGINFPRGFNIDPSGTWLYVGNQKGDTIVQFRINQSTGALTPTGQVTPSITPVSIEFKSGSATAIPGMPNTGGGGGAGADGTLGLLGAIGLGAALATLARRRAARAASSPAADAGDEA